MGVIVNTVKSTETCKIERFGNMNYSHIMDSQFSKSCGFNSLSLSNILSEVA